MEQNQKKFNEISGNKVQKINEKEYCSNIFRNIDKFDKNKSYRELENGLNLLKQDIKLMEEFSKDQLLNKRKKISKRINIKNNDKDNKYKRNTSRRLNSIYMRNKINLMDKSNNSSTNNLNNIETEENNINNNNINIYKDIIKKSRNNKKIHINRSSNLSLQKYQINLNNNNKNSLYKTEINNYNNLINGQKIPNLYLSSDQVNDSDLDDIKANSNSSSRLPLITETPTKKNFYLLTDNNTNNIKSNDNINNLKYKQISSVKKSLKDNTFIKNFPKVLNSTNHKINHNDFPLQTDKILLKMKEKNIKIKNGINEKINEQNLINWEMKSKFKLANWKYGIAEVQKYFIDLQEYGKPEEVELIKRKTFYDLLDELIDDVKKTKKEKELKAIEDKYNNNNKDRNKFGNVKKKQDKKMENNNNDINDVDNFRNKKIELCEVLKNVKLRRIREKRRRNLINNIMIKSDIKIKAINDSTNKIQNE